MEHNNNNKAEREISYFLLLFLLANGKVGNIYVVERSHTRRIQSIFNKYVTSAVVATFGALCQNLLHSFPLTAAFSLLQ